VFALIHRSAWNRYSRKLNFAFREFLEVRKESCRKYCNGVIRSLSSESMVQSLRGQQPAA
jgi:hypothetical protein